MNVNTTEIWSRLRSTRSSPPGKASQVKHRKQTYAASMEQFEQLMDAATRVNSTARPLPLYYALNQAGRSISAAYADDPWRLRGHGLHLLDEDSPNLIIRRVKPDTKAASAFRRVAEITGSDTLNEPVTIGALCASLPELANTEQLIGTHPRALYVSPIRQSGGVLVTMNSEVEAHVFNFPSRLTTSDTKLDDLRGYMSNYPTADGWRSNDPLRVFPARGNWGAGAILKWATRNPEKDYNEWDRQQRMREVAPPYRRVDRQWCRPNVCERTFLSPLMTWWAVLYSLSMIARYEPDYWVNLLDVDRSEFAVPLEETLSKALDAVPQLVLSELLAEVFLVSAISDQL